ncbi:hypothetical protein KIL84_016494 [Mauremys mutica]|uniref:Uncharacterized protein n=1 Tax=Mauremys mutica TaxID=74926 RepID=A0A9D3X500_9SAUR|nr:hypothetical protein KIL84_016494 [Mauremys mutica]
MCMQQSWDSSFCKAEQCQTVIEKTTQPFAAPRVSRHAPHSQARPSATNGSSLFQANWPVVSNGIAAKAAEMQRGPMLSFALRLLSLFKPEAQCETQGERIHMH